jgi:hypothetical protein
MEKTNVEETNQEGHENVENIMTRDKSGYFTTLIVVPGCESEMYKPPKFLSVYTRFFSFLSA